MRLADGDIGRSCCCAAPRPCSPRCRSGRSGGASAAARRGSCRAARPRRRRALRRGLGAFMIAVFNTSTANLVFILAFNTMFCGGAVLASPEGAATSGDAGDDGSDDRRRADHRLRRHRQRSLPWRSLRAVLDLLIATAITLTRPAAGTWASRRWWRGAADDARRPGGEPHRAARRPRPGGSSSTARS